MISNYHPFDSLDASSYFEDLLLFDDLDLKYLLLEEMYTSPYSDGYLLEDVVYEIFSPRIEIVKTADVPHVEIKEQENYLLFDEPDNSGFSRVYSFLEELITHLMYGYLEQDTYPERDYLVYEEIDAIRDVQLPLIVA